MKILLYACAGMLLLGMLDLPIGYYTLLRLTVSIGALAVIVTEFEDGFNVWIFIFGFILLLFNPIIPVHLNSKEAWVIIDLIVAIIFFAKTITINTNKTDE